MGAKKGTKYRPWTPAEQAVVRAHYARLPWHLVAELLPGRTADNVERHARCVLGLRRTAAENARILRRYNTGRFQKGVVSGAELYDGACTVRTDKQGRQLHWLRLGRSRWVQLHRHRWEQLHGPLPRGHVLRCLDGDTLNHAPDNWELISCRENMRRNSGAVHLADGYVACVLAGRRPLLQAAILRHPELLEAGRLQLKLKRFIKEKENKETSTSKRTRHGKE
jgi:hypothetical protein